MLAFSTEFPIQHKHDSRAFIQAFSRWLLGSPHTDFVEADFSGFAEQSQAERAKNKERVTLIQFAAASEQSVAIRYAKRAEGIEWETSVVFSRNSTDSWVAIRVSRESSYLASSLPPAKKPVLVRTLLNELGGALDGVLQVGSSPHHLAETDVESAARLMTGESASRLPIVYISARFGGVPTVDARRMARDLAGLAHVVVEPSRPFSLRLKFEVGGQNVYGGTIGVYWPDGGGRKAFSIGAAYPTSDDLASAIQAEVLSALKNRRGIARCSLASVQELASRQALDAIRANGSAELVEFAKVFDQEIVALRDKNEEAEKEIWRLRNEVLALEARLPVDGGTLLSRGIEQDLYQGEILSIVRDALEEAQTNSTADSRRAHILADVVAANAEAPNTAKAMKEELKRLLRAYKTMDRQTKKGLEDLGFVVGEEGKHIKLVFQSDDRYTFTLAKSGSDYRGGLNAVGDIGRLLF